MQVLRTRPAIIGYRQQSNACEGIRYFCQKNRLRLPWIPYSGMDTDIRERFQSATLNFKVPLLILSLGCAGLFVRPIVRRVPALILLDRAYSVNTVVARRENVFTISLRAWPRGAVH